MLSRSEARRREKTKTKVRSEDFLRFWRESLLRAYVFVIFLRLASLRLHFFAHGPPEDDFQVSHSLLKYEEQVRRGSSYSVSVWDATFLSLVLRECGGCSRLMLLWLSGWSEHVSDEARVNSQSHIRKEPDWYPVEIYLWGPVKLTISG